MQDAAANAFDHMAVTRRAFLCLAGASAAVVLGAVRPEPAHAGVIGRIIDRIDRDSGGTADEAGIVATNALEAHLVHLVEHHDEIVAYDWQEAGSGSTGYAGDSMPMVRNSHNVALLDLTGDGEPELLWLAGDASRPSEEPAYRSPMTDEEKASFVPRAKLHAARWTGSEERVLFDGDGFPWTLEDADWANNAEGAIGLDDVRFGDGSISDPLYMPEMCWDSRVRNFGGRNYVLFVSGDDDSLYALVDLSEEVTSKTVLARLGIDYQYDTLAWVDPPYVRVSNEALQTTEYFYGETPISFEEYESRRAWIFGQATKIVAMNGPLWVPEGFSLLRDPSTADDPDALTRAEQLATSYGEALFNIATELGMSVAVYPDSRTDIHLDQAFTDRFEEKTDFTHGEYVSWTLSEMLRKYPSDAYCPKLAHLLSAVATAAYDKEHGRDSLVSIGCTEEVYGYNFYDDPSDPAYGPDQVGFYIGLGSLDDGRPLVVVSIRGSYGEIDMMEFLRLMALELVGAEDAFSSSTLPPDWASDLNLGAARNQVSLHEGFYLAAREVYEAIEERMGVGWRIDSIDQCDAVFVMTGHSRGSGVGNLVAKMLIDAGFPKERLYCYFFACPDTARDYPGSWNKDGRYDSIYNIGYAADVVSRVPGFMADLYGTAASGVTGQFDDLGTQWGKYGNSYWYSEDWSSTVDVSPGVLEHIPQNYVSHLRSEPPLSDFFDYTGLEVSFGTQILIGLLKNLV